MHLSIVCLTYPTWGMDGANMVDLSLKPGPMGRARWGIGQNCALTRKLKIDVHLAFLMHHNRYWSDLTWGMGVWRGKGPYNYASYIGQSMKSIGQIPHLPQVGEVGHTIDRCIRA